MHRLLARVYQDSAAIASGRFIERHEFQVFQRKCERGMATDVPSGVELRVFERPTDILALTDQGYDLGTPNNYTDALAPTYVGGKLYALFVGKRLAHFSRSMADRRDPNFGPFLPGIGHPKDICIGPCHTDPAYRGKGLYALALNRICADAGAQGTGAALIYSSTTNSSSINGIIKADFKSIGRITRNRWLLWTLTKFTSDQGQDLS
jgi:hypothetical protein